MQQITGRQPVETCSKYIAYDILIASCRPAHVIPFHPFPGEETWKKKKITRQIIKRLLMGPASMFTPALLADELAAHANLKIWGLIIHNNNLIDPCHFLEQLLPQPIPEVYTGRVQPGVSANLCIPSAWKDPTFLNFGSDDIKANRRMGKVLSHQHMTYEFMGLHTSSPT